MSTPDLAATSPHRGIRTFRVPRSSRRGPQAVRAPQLTASAVLALVGTLGLLHPAALAHADPATPPPSSPTTTSPTATSPTGETPAAPDAAVSATPVVDALRASADQVRPVIESDLARSLLDATAHAREPGPRIIYRNADRSRLISARAYDALPESDREGLTPRTVPPEYYYDQRYGSPVIYARVLDIAARHGITSLNGLRVMDFGCGTAGHLQLMAHAGAHAHGIDVEPLLAAYYDQPGDLGKIGPGTAELTIDRWPATENARTRVGVGYDLITSKNTLKAGYIHPKPPEGQQVDPRTIIDLGVDDDTFLKALFNALKPGGLLIIYNISPKQAGPGEQYIPWADGNSPWTRERYQAEGFEVLEFDVSDDATIFRVFAALGYDQGVGAQGLVGTMFSHVTVLRRPAKDDAGPR